MVYGVFDFVVFGDVLVYWFGGVVLVYFVFFVGGYVLVGFV